LFPCFLFLLFLVVGGGFYFGGRLKLSLFPFIICAAIRRRLRSGRLHFVFRRSRRIALFFGWFRVIGGLRFLGHTIDPISNSTPPAMATAKTCGAPAPVERKLIVLIGEPSGL
jgi:hypothetical protein